MANGTCLTVAFWALLVNGNSSLARWMYSMYSWIYSYLILSKTGRLPKFNFFFRTAQYNDENLARNQVKTIFLTGSSERMVLHCIRRTMDYPDLTYTQRDGARVCVKRYRFPVGEMVWFDEDRRLVTRLLNRVKVVYTRDREGDIRIITAFPLLWHQVLTIFS